MIMKRVVDCRVSFLRGYFYNEMWYINLRFTYLLTYLLTYLESAVCCVQTRHLQSPDHLAG